MNATRFVASIPLLTVAVLGASTAAAQQVVEDARMNVRLTIPQNWTWEPKTNGPFIRCEPARRDLTDCYLQVARRHAPPRQAAISDLDRRKWRDDASGRGLYPIISARDVKIAGYPAFETRASMDGATVYRVFVLMDSPARVIDMTYMASWGGRDYVERYKAAMDTVLGTLAPARERRATK